MATSAGFKQQCPSCEAMVPVRDDSLIGRKIDCPKCKYRFVVEAPAEEEEDAEEEEIPAKSKPAKGKSKAKAKDEVEDEAEDEGDDEERPKTKKKPSPTVLVGAGLGVVGVLVLSFGLYFFLFSGGSSSKPSGGGGATSVGATPSAGGATGARPGAAMTGAKPVEAGKVVESSPVAVAADITNLLPNDTSSLVSLEMEKFLSSSFNKAAFLTRGAFSADDFEQTYGFPLENVQRILVALNKSDGIFTILRTVKPYDPELLQKRLSLVAENPVNNQVYFTVKGSLDAFSNLIVKGQQYRERIQLRCADPRTLVFADPPTMAKFLLAGGKPRALSDAGPAVAESGGQAAKSGSPAQAAAKSETDSRSGGRRRESGSQDSAAAETTSSEARSGSYLTISPHLKVLLDRIEKYSKHPMICAVSDPHSPLANDLIEYVRAKLKPGSSGEPIDKQLKQLDDSVYDRIKYVGLVLEAFNEEKGTALLVVDTTSDAAARSMEVQLQPVISAVGPALESALGMAAPAQQPMPPGTSGVIPQRPQPMMMPQQNPGPRFGGMGRRRRDEEDRGRSGPMLPPQPQFGVPPPPAGGPDSAASRLANLTLIDQTVLVSIDLPYPDNAYRRLLHEAESYFVVVRGFAEMADNCSHIHELAGVIQAYVQDKNQFPRGTLPRQGEGGDHSGDLPPALRHSWFADLLPYLPGDYKELPREAEKWWQEGENLATAQILVPQFLTRIPPFYVRYPGVATPVAGAHFVGIAGVGLDAANYSGKDAATAKKIGIFGYDRVTTTAMVKDGLEQTIVALQVPPASANPWLAGGGSTVRGVSEQDNPLEPFICADYEGKPGTFAIMADGKVRFVPADLAPAKFRAMCTIAGNDSVGHLESLCPVVPAPAGDCALRSRARAKTELKTSSTSQP